MTPFPRNTAAGSHLPVYTMTITWQTLNLRLVLAKLNILWKHPIVLGRTAEEILSNTTRKGSRQTVTSLTDHISCSILHPQGRSQRRNETYSTFLPTLMSKSKMRFCPPFMRFCPNVPSISLPSTSFLFLSKPTNVKYGAHRTASGQSGPTC